MVEQGKITGMVGLNERKSSTHINVLTVQIPISDPNLASLVLRYWYVQRPGRVGLVESLRPVALVMDHGSAAY